MAGKGSDGGRCAGASSTAGAGAGEAVAEEDDDVDEGMGVGDGSVVIFLLIQSNTYWPSVLEIMNTAGRSCENNAKKKKRDREMTS